MNTEPRTGVQLERERVTCLLLINTQLMKKAINLYVNILTNQQALQLLPPQNKQSIIELYQNCTRRLHCNLAVLSTVHEKYHSTVPLLAQPNKPQFPVIMSAEGEIPAVAQTGSGVAGGSDAWNAKHAKHASKYPKYAAKYPKHATRYGSKYTTRYAAKHSPEHAKHVEYAEHVERANASKHHATNTHLLAGSIPGSAARHDTQ